MLSQSLQAMLEPGDGTPVEVLDFESLDMNWDTGVEEFQEMNAMQLHELLGLPKEGLPFFNRKEDPMNAHDPWSEEGQEWLKTSKDAVAFGPRWHQLVGIAKMTRRMLASQPMFVFDEVGVGKTMQAVGLIALRAYYVHHYQKHGHLPGQWDPSSISEGENTGGLKDEPVVVVTTVSLLSQLLAELRRYLQRGCFDVLPYTGSHKTRAQWWELYYVKSKTQKCQQIIVTTYSVRLALL